MLNPMLGERKDREENAQHYFALEDFVASGLLAAEVLASVNDVEARIRELELNTALGRECVWRAALDEAELHGGKLAQGGDFSAAHGLLVHPQSLSLNEMALGLDGLGFACAITLGLGEAGFWADAFTVIEFVLLARNLCRCRPGRR